MNPTMLQGLGSLISSILGSFAVDQDRARIQGPGRGAERIDGTAPLIPVEIQELEKADSGKPNILLDSEGFPVRRDPDMMQSEFENPFIMIGTQSDEDTDQKNLDIRDLLNMLFNRG